MSILSNDPETQAGLATRRAVLGNDYVDAALNRATPFTAPLQELVTKHAWGNTWQREGLDLKTRSIVTVAMLVALGRNHLRMLQHLGVPADRLRMLRAFDPRSGAHVPDVEDPYYGTQDDFETTYTVIDAALPGLHRWVDEQLAGREQAG